MFRRLEDVDWRVLGEEFEVFELDEEAREVPSEPLVRSLTAPVPRFVGALLVRRFKDRSLSPEHVKALFFFLLHKRYTERLNLLYFAFSLFDEEGCLPAELIAQIPFPHEDGIPRYGLCLDKTYEC